MATFETLACAVQNGDAPAVRNLMAELLCAGTNPEDILDLALRVGMQRIGCQFKANEVFVPDVLLAARAMHAGMAVLEQRLQKPAVPPIGTMILGTVEGDLHDIGKNLVRVLAEVAGIAVVDLGVDVTPSAFLAAAKRHPEARVIGMSALLTTTMTAMTRVIDRFGQAGLRQQFRFIVGGAPLSERYAAKLGADSFAPDAATAVDQLKAWLSDPA